MSSIAVAGRLLLFSALLAASLSADTSFAIQNGATDSGGAISGTVDFSISCTTTCALDILFSGAEGDPTSAAQLISGVTFDLADSGTPLSIGSASVSPTITNGSGHNVGVINSNGTSGTSIGSTPARWGVISSGKDFDLTTLTGGKPNYLIMGGGPYTNMNSSIVQHSPSLVGPVEFSIVGIAGLNSSTVVSNVKILMGTAPDAIITQVTCSGNCGTPILNQGGSSPSTPEPVSFLLAGSALGALTLIRRHAQHR